MKHKKHPLSNVLLLACLLLSFLATVSSIQAQPRKVTWEDLEELSNGKYPKNSSKMVTGGFFSTPPHMVTIQTPRLQAHIYAELAKEEYVKLDSSSYYPDLFNRYIRLLVENISGPAFNNSVSREDVRQVERCILLIDDEPIEADSTVFLKTTLQNAYGAESVNVDAVCYFPLELFDGTKDIKIVVFDDQGKSERKLKKKDIKKLE